MDKVMDLMACQYIIFKSYIRRTYIATRGDGWVRTQLLANL